MKPEEQARRKIDELLEAAGWSVQDPVFPNLQAKRGVAIRETTMTTGFADYLLLVEQKVIGVIEAKPAGFTLSGVVHQARKYGQGTKEHMKVWLPGRPLPFSYMSTGYETLFRNDLDPAPRSSRVFAFHQPETLAKWVEAYQDGQAILRGRSAERRLADLVALVR